MSEVKRNEITAEGLKALKDRLEYLKTTGRAQISELIATARSFGDRPLCITPTSRPGRRTAGASISC